MPAANDNLPRLMQMTEVVRAIGLSRAMINIHRKSGNFPKAVPLGDKRIAFLRSEVDAWIDQRIAARDQREAA